MEKINVSNSVKLTLFKIEKREKGVKSKKENFSYHR